MTDGTGNHTLRLLQEMRNETREQYEDLRTRIDGLSVLMTSSAGIAHDHEERIERLEQ